MSAPAVAGAAWRGGRLRAQLAAFAGYLGRRPRSPAAWRRSRGVGVGMVVGLLVAVAPTMLLVDVPAVALAQRLPEPLIAAFDEITDFGKANWLLVPAALALAAIALFALLPLTRMARLMLAALAVRLVFLLAAVALPGLTCTVGKRLIGRARPLVEGAADPFLYRPLRWHVEYASLPSGHATDAFAIAMALGVLWPRARPVLWAYAAVIAASRVVLTAHYPSDVLAGAAVGILGVLLVRAWFAARGLAFGVAEDGGIRPFPGPSLRRIKRVARQLVAS